MYVSVPLRLDMEMDVREPVKGLEAALEEVGVEEGIMGLQDAALRGGLV